MCLWWHVSIEFSCHMWIGWCGCRMFDQTHRSCGICIEDNCSCNAVFTLMQCTIGIHHHNVFDDLNMQKIVDSLEHVMSVCTQHVSNMTFAKSRLLRLLLSALSLLQSSSSLSFSIALRRHLLLVMFPCVFLKQQRTSFDALLINSGSNPLASSIVVCIVVCIVVVAIIVVVVMVVRTETSLPIVVSNEL